jgi:hypothetical protein
MGRKCKGDTQECSSMTYKTLNELKEPFVALAAAHLLITHLYMPFFDILQVQQYKN